MRLSLAMVDRVVRKLGPMNALVANLSERVLPKKDALASGHCPTSYYWCGSAPCGKGGIYYGRYATDPCAGLTWYVACDC
ncbi:hypothetical protein [Ktedonospora formicarum]|uniref:Uncharacterized protein n=1 Tax=Ktedonospora formicarum TaxID=2778364 RepID=A0A8J3HZE5_9CHLR|nr:hypothetical protein [Ktedonospora formicarum]GHO45981.1 hypothetical protein KSX_41440 [Ktedonospora formicarum]